MRTLLFLIQKEFLQIFRNKVLLRLMLVLPVVQLIVLVNAATLDVKDNCVIIVDQDGTSMSQGLISKFNASPFFRVLDITPELEPAMKRFRGERIDAILVIPHRMEKDYHRSGSSSVQLLTNAINSTRAQLTYSYTQALVNDYNGQIGIAQSSVTGSPVRVNASWRYWFNPELNYKYYMLPGILVILVTLVGMFMAAINLVREKEMGTLEQINVTPVRRSQFITAKLVPFWMIGMFELALGLIIGKLLYHIPFEGSLVVLFLFAGVYLVAMLALGLLISTSVQTQQQVLFMSYFFLLIFIMMSGLFTPVENMPDWGQAFNRINPLYYFIETMRRVLLKGSGFADILPLLAGVGAIALVALPLAIYSYKKTN